MYKNEKMLFRQTTLIAILSLLFCSVGLQELKAQDTLRNLPEFSLPMTDHKMVLAHCMTHIIRTKDRKFEDGANPDYYPNTPDNPSQSIGGYTLVDVMSDRFLKDSSLDAAVEFEMRAAMRCGIDGFQFYYQLGNSSWDRIVEAYFKVADEKNLDFKFALCLSHPGDGDTSIHEDVKIATYARRINGIMAKVGRDNKHWLRTPDGRLVVYLWYGEQMADIPWNNMKGYPEQFYWARAYRKLANAVGERFACAIVVNNPKTSTEINNYLDYFPAVWMWTGAYSTPGEAEKFAAACKERHRTFEGSAFPDFFTSKILQPENPAIYWHILWFNDAMAAGVNGIQRNYMVTGLSQTFRQCWELAIQQNVPVMNIITWNDYPEGHHLAPEVNHNYGFSVLNQYYKSVWEGKPSPYADRDVAEAFFKKYKSNATPDPYNVQVVTIGKTANASTEDSIDVVTILPKPGQLRVNGETVDVPAGLTSTKFKSQPGAVNVAVLRNGVVTKSFVTPEWITDKPYRTDKLTYTFGTEYMNFNHDIFGDKPILYSTQYNKDVKKP